MDHKTSRPTESELEILQVLWTKKSASVRDVHEAMMKNHKETGYTTTLKLMQIMLEKGIVCRDGSRKVHMYQPLISKENTQRLFVDKMVDGLFSGSSAQLVLQALGNMKASKSEIDEIKRFLETID